MEGFRSRRKTSAVIAPHNISTMNENEEKPKMGFSFGFSRKQQIGPLKTTSVINETKKEAEETDFITAVEGDKVKSVVEKQVRSGPLIIPLIGKQAPGTSTNTKPKALSNKDSIGTENKKNDSIEAQAARALIEEARRREYGAETEETAASAAPILMQQKLDTEAGVTTQAEQSTLDDYESVPIEQFGLAMLRGMGWKEGQGIGKNEKKVAPVEATLRPKGMGLGADKSTVLQDKHKQKNSKLKPGDVRKHEEPLDYKKGKRLSTMGRR